MDELLFDENYIVFLQNQSLDTLCSLYLEVHNQLMDIIHTHNGEENYKEITAKRAMIEGTIMTKVMQNMVIHLINMHIIKMIKWWPKNTILSQSSFTFRSK